MSHGIEAKWIIGCPLFVEPKAQEPLTLWAITPERISRFNLHWVKTCLHRRWLVFCTLAGIAMFGLFALKQLALEAYPDVGDVTAQVITQYPGTTCSTPRTTPRRRNWL